MPSDSQPPRQRRDPTGAMIGAAIRAERRAHKKQQREPESSGSGLLTVLVVVVLTFGTLALALYLGT